MTSVHHNHNKDTPKVACVTLNGSEMLWRQCRKNKDFEIYSQILFLFSMENLGILISAYLQSTEGVFRKRGNVHVGLLIGPPPETRPKNLLS